MESKIVTSPPARGSRSKPRSKVQSRIIQPIGAPARAPTRLGLCHRARFSDICLFWSPTLQPSSLSEVSRSSSGPFFRDWGVNTRSPLTGLSPQAIAADCPGRCQVPFPSRPSSLRVITSQDLSCVVPVVWACVCVEEVGVIYSEWWGGDDGHRPL